MKRMYSLLPVLLLTALVISCSKSNESDLDNDGGNNGGNTCDTANMKFTANVKPILQSNCYSCHSNANSSASGGVKLEDYADVKAHADDGDLLGTITHSSGFPPMPQGGNKLSECNINKIRAWVERGALNN